MLSGPGQQFSDSEVAGNNVSLYESFYHEVDPHNKGIVTADDAVGFLKRSTLSSDVLGKIWEVADRNKHGYLTKSEFFVCLKLVALAQQGRGLNVSLLSLDAQAPSFAPAHRASVEVSATTLDWGIKPEDREKYSSIFLGLGPENGKLSGDKAKPVLINSGLGVAVLGKIWDLSDIDKDGCLDCDEMIVALHLVYCALKNESVPAALPISLVPPSKRFAVSGAASVARKASLNMGSPAMQIGSTQSLGRTGSQRSRTSSVSSIEGMGFGTGFANIPSAAVELTAPHGSRSLSGTPTPQVKPPAPWVVDKARWEPMFVEADKNCDGLVSGTDIKVMLMQSGLAQNYLAHIWALCDIKQTGTLNLEQFALAMHFIEQKRLYNVEPPPTLQPDLVPPSFRPSPAGMTDMGTSTHPDGDAFSSLLGTYAGAASAVHGPESKEIEMIAKEIEALQAEKRGLDGDIMQLESDLTVKQSEIKNLEVELVTLDATVSQLERQKGEARRRLDDLDTQRTLLGCELEDIKAKLQSETIEFEGMKSEVENTTSTIKEQEEQLNQKRQELQRLRDEEAKLEVKVQMGRSSLQQASQRETQIETQITQVTRNCDLVRQQLTVLCQKLDTLQNVVNSGDMSALETDSSILSRDPSLQLESISSFSVVDNSCAFPVTSDPFKSADPFGGIQHNVDVDPFAASDPFASSGAAFHEDPFAQTGSVVGSFDAFGCAFSTQTFQDDPFAPMSQQGSRGSAVGAPSRPPPPGSTAAKKPPRPAPPKSRPITPSDPLDPWGGSSSEASGAGFANFADFGKFN